MQARLLKGEPHAWPVGSQARLVSRVDQTNFRPPRAPTGFPSATPGGTRGSLHPASQASAFCRISQGEGSALEWKQQPRRRRAGGGPARPGVPFPAHLGWIPVLGPLGRGSGRMRLCPGAPRCSHERMLRAWLRSPRHGPVAVSFTEGVSCTCLHANLAHGKLLGVCLPP